MSISTESLCSQNEARKSVAVALSFASKKPWPNSSRDTTTPVWKRLRYSHVKHVEFFLVEFGTQSAPVSFTSMTSPAELALTLPSLKVPGGVPKHEARGGKIIREDHVNRFGPADEPLQLCFVFILAKFLFVSGNKGTIYSQSADEPQGQFQH